MALNSHEIEPSDLRDGDHVYTWRNGSAYAHHGIYVGADRIVHYAKDSGKVSMCPVNKFLDENSLRRFEYGVDRRAFKQEFRGGTCTTAEPDPPETVVHRATYLLHHQGFGSYNLLSKNCEDFALYCKTGLLVPGKWVSGQVRFGVNAAKIVAVLATMVLSPYLIPVSVLTAAMLAKKYRNDRYNKDIGVRIEAIKVEVEKIATLFP